MRFQVLAVNHGIQKPVLQKKFRGLKSFGKFLPDGLLDHARAGETDERARLGNVQVAQHGETGRNTAGGRR